MNKHLARILVALTVAMMTVAQPIASAAVQAAESPTIENNNGDGSGTQNEAGKTGNSGNAGNSSSKTPAAAMRTYSFYVNGEAYGNSQTIESGSKLKAPSAPTTKTGWEFKGWYLEDSESAFDFEQQITFTAEEATENVRLIAKIEQTKEVLDAYNDLIHAATLEELNEKTVSLAQYFDAFTEEQQASLTEKMDSFDGYNAQTTENGTDTYTYTITVAAGASSETLGTSRVSRDSLSYSVNPSTNGITASRNSGNGETGYKISVASAVPAGEYVVTVTYDVRNNNGKGPNQQTTSHADTIKLTVTSSSSTDTPSTGDKVKVYVYVASDGFSDEMYDLLKIDKDTLDNNGYFPAGIIELDSSWLNGKTTSEGNALINSDQDWEQLLTALSNMDVNSMVQMQGKDYSKNNGNNVKDYISQAEKSLGSSWGSKKTALFHWHYVPANTGSGQSSTCQTWGHGDSTNYGFADQTGVLYHLDLKFSTKKITFITGNNGITEGTAKDGTEFDSRTYITGSDIQEPKTLKVPDGYQLVGFYTDSNCTEGNEWNGIGTQLNENQTVYAKITKLENTVLKYVVAEGEGSVSPTDEAFNPVTGSWKGSTATAAAGYAFEGWYADADCTQKLSGDVSYTPVKPEGGWEAGKTYYYYAKFVPANKNLTITKTLSGNMYDSQKEFAFKITADKAFTVGEETYQAGSAYTTSLGMGKSVIISIPQDATVTVVEDKSGYEQKVTVPEGMETSNVTDGNYTGVSFTMPANDVSVTFDNSKNATPDTGISLDSLPYLVILALVAAGVVIFIRKRRRSFDD